MVQENLTKILEKRFDKTIKEASNEEIYLALLELTKGTINKKGTNKGDKNFIIFQLNF